MANPQYGKQYIRFAETALVADNVAIPQFRLVIDAGAGTDPVTVTNVVAAAGEALGVIQQEKNLASTGYATDLYREATIATSGLLLIEMDGANALSAGDALTVDATGRASNANPGVGSFAMTVNGTTPVVRQVVAIGGLSQALVSFA